MLCAVWSAHSCAQSQVPMRALTPLLFSTTQVLVHINFDYDAKHVNNNTASQFTSCILYDSLYSVLFAWAQHQVQQLKSIIPPCTHANSAALGLTPGTTSPPRHGAQYPKHTARSSEQRQRPTQLFRTHSSCPELQLQTEFLFRKTVGFSSSSFLLFFFFTVLVQKNPQCDLHVKTP